MTDAIKNLIDSKLIAGLTSNSGMVEILLDPKTKIIIDNNLDVKVYKKVTRPCLKCDGDGYDAYDGSGFPCSKCNGLRNIPTFILQK